MVGKSKSVSILNTVGKVQPYLQHIPYHIANQFSWRERKWKYVFFKMAARLKNIRTSITPVQDHDT